MKLNRKGYLTVEIILASTIAFAIAFFLIEITVKLVSKTDDVYHETVIAYDDAIIINNIKEKIKDMSEDEIYELLASDGMLIKRPLFISNTLILKGFKEKEWEQIKGENNAIN